MKRIELPSLPGRPHQRTIRQIRYLLPRSETYQAENARAVDQALNGEWEQAHRLWFSLPGENDCALLNNQGISLSMRGRNREALRHLSRANALCPDSDPIRKNLETVLDSGARNQPRYHHRPGRKTSPPGKSEPEGESVK